MRNVERLCLAHFWVAFAAFLAACRPRNLADVGSQPAGGPCRHAGTIFHVGDGARRLDGLRADHLLHHGLRLFRRRDRARPSAPGQALGLGRLLDGDRRRGDGGGADCHGPGVGALHVLSSAHGQPLVLYRAGAGRGRLVDMVRSHARRDARVETRKSRPAGAVGHVRDGGECGAVALDHRRRGGRADLSGHPGGTGPGADRRCRPRAHAVLLDAARHRLFLADPGLYRVLHDRAARGGRTPLQRHDGPHHLHSVPDLQPAGRNASPADGSRARQCLEVHPGAAHGLRLRADAADDLHHLGLAGDCRAPARRPRRFRLDRGAALGPAGRARGRTCPS